jgi:hypothetical protein
VHAAETAQSEVCRVYGQEVLALPSGNERTEHILVTGHQQQFIFDEILLLDVIVNNARHRAGAVRKPRQ